jgi:tRNA(Ile)-lysidine synthase
MSPKRIAAASRSSRRLEGSVLRFVRRHELVEAGQRVLVALSGGADSTALLLILATLADRLGVEVRAAYFDHRLRGRRAGERERSYAAALTKELGLPLTTGEDDVRPHARASGLSLEEAARELRYRFLAQAAADAGSSVVAVGHTADDQTETVLMHILRGSGLVGLGGMTPSAAWPVKVGGGAPTVVRPLLEVARAETSGYCRERGVRPLEDPTNRSLAPLRNRVRHELLPVLRRYNPRVDAALQRLARAAAADQGIVDGMAAAVLAEGGAAYEGEIRLSRRRLQDLPDTLRLHVLRLATRQLLGEVRDIGATHLQDMAQASLKEVGTRLDLPHGLRLSVDYEHVALAGGRPDEPPSTLPEEPVTLAVPGSTRVGPWLFQTEVTDLPAAVAGGAEEALVDLDAVGEELWVRRRRPGDRFQPLGLRAEKKLQDFFVDAKVPRGQRDGVPLLCARRGVVWVVGHRIAEWARIRGTTGRVLRLRALPPQ